MDKHVCSVRRIIIDHKSITILSPQLHTRRTLMYLGSYNEN